MKKFLTLIFITLFTFMNVNVNATHYMGGEITWECLSNGNFRFITKVYRECDGINYPNPITMNSNSPAGNITMYLYPNPIQGKLDISPDCNDDPIFANINCYPDPGVSNTGAVEEWTYTSDQAYPNGITLNGVPPASGWVFSYRDCCRNPCSNIPNSNNLYWFLRAVMYPYNGQNNNPCWDDSPVFSEIPSTVICTGYPFTYNHNAFDKQLDSLSYEWAQPMTNSNAPITTYNAGYSYTSPLPGTFHNPNNVNSVVNPYTGEISFTSFTQGAFVTVTKVTAYKCGIKIAEIFREMQIVLLPCGYNSPPDVTAPFQNQTTGLFTEYIDTVYAGEIVNFFISAIDTLPLYLANGDLQTVTLEASGSAFGDGYTSTTTGCLSAPCATMSPAPPISNLYGLSSTFNWQTDCNHLQTDNGCGSISNVYNFVLKVYDDYCPAPGINIGTVTIVILNPILENPDLKCVSVDSIGDVILSWIPPDTSYLPNKFYSYDIYHSNNINGPYVLIDSVMNYNTTVYTHNGALGDTLVNYYYLKTNSGCFEKFESNPSDTLSSILLNVTSLSNDVAELDWNFNHIPPLSTSGYFYIYRKNPGFNWLLIDSTFSNYYTDTLDNACGYVDYKIELYDSSGCYSVSSIDNDLFQNATPSEIGCISVENDGYLTLEWLLPTDPTTTNNFYCYYIYSSQDNIIYTLLDSVMNLNTTNYLDLTNDGSQNIVYYFMKIKIYCGDYFVSNSSDTINSIYLDITKLSSITSYLDWNDIRLNNISTLYDKYTLYKGYDINNLYNYDSLINIGYYDTNIVCYDSIYYRVNIEDSIGCINHSNVVGEAFFDDTPPNTPYVDSVSVTSLNNVIVTWKPSTSDDVIGYIIYHFDNVWNPIDTVYDTNMYIDYINDPCDKSQSYVISSIDSCGLVSPMSIDSIHQTLFIEFEYSDPCLNVIKFKWNDYINMNPEIYEYYLYVGENDSNYKILDVVTNISSGYYTYTHKDLKEDTEYCYYVKAVSIDGSKSSTSCTICKYSLKQNLPEYLYIRYVTVENNEYIKMVFNVDITSNVKQYNIYRSDNLSGPYDLIGNVNPQGMNNLEFYDYDVNVKNQSYYYKVINVDSCDNDTYISEYAKTIYLEAFNDNKFINTINFNDYEGWFWSGVKKYNIYRIVDNMVDPIPIVELQYGSNSFDDDISNLIVSEGDFKYYVEAIEDMNYLNFSDTSRSNIYRIIQPSRIFMANSFSPKGYNSKFKPIIVFTVTDDYEFTVYNRWGMLIFTTNNIYDEWDGTYKGEYVPGGVYVYVVKYQNSRHKYNEKIGTVTVLY